MEKRRLIRKLVPFLAYAFLLIILAVPVRAAAVIRVQIVAKTPEGSLIPVPGALCQVTAGDEIKESWTNADGILSTPSVTGKVSISPVALPAGFKYDGEQLPVLEIDSEETVSVPAEGEAPPQIHVATSMRVPTLSLHVVDEKHAGVQDVTLLIATEKEGVKEAIVTGADGHAMMTLGSGFYYVTVVGLPDDTFQTPDRIAVFLVSDQVTEISLSQLAIPTTTEPEPKTEPTTSPTTTTETEEIETTPSKKPEDHWSEKSSSPNAVDVFTMIFSLLTLLGVGYLVMINISLRRGGY
jgi:hypothetical protein